MRVADYPTIQDYVGQAVMETNASRLFVYSVAQAFDKATDDNTIVLEPGVLARGNFLHWAWQIKFVAAQNAATHVDKMLHACGGSGYKRDMELERYLRDAKAGWVMGPTNEVLRQFVGKAVLLGFESLDYWNQSYNRRAVENEVKKLDADREARARRAAPRRGRRGRGQGAGEGLVDGRAPSRPRLLVPGLVPRDPGRETYRVRPGGTTTVSLRPDDRLTVRDLHGGQRGRRLGAAARRQRADARLAGRRGASSSAPDVAARAPRRRSAPSATPSSRSSAPAGRAGDRGRRCRPPTSSSRSRARQPRRGRQPSSACPIRSPTRGSTSRSTAPRRSPTR